MVLQIAIDCADPHRLVEFWSQALHYDVEPPPEGYGTWNEYWLAIGVPDHELDHERDSVDSIVDPAGHGPRIFFQLVPEPKSVKNRIHLDLKISGGRATPMDERRRRIHEEVDRVIALGATRLRVNEQEGLDHYGVVLQDPEGNEFCVA